MSNLLVIDDDVQMLSSLSDVLSQAGYIVASASSGQQALEIAESKSFDLVISDVRMAGMDGIECIERLSQGRSELKSIVITGFASDDVPGRAMDLASCDYLFKPFTAEQLILSVSRALGVPEAEQAESFTATMREAGLALSELENARKRAFRNFYLGVRSGHLTSALARSVWVHLEQIELRRLELTRQLELRMEAVELAERYMRVSVVARNREPGSLGEPSVEGATSRVGFQPLYRNIREGKVSCEDVMMAVLARYRIQHDHSESGADRELYSTLWT